MPSNQVKHSQEVTVSGTGNGWEATELTDLYYPSGEILYVQVRQHSTGAGTATAADIYIVESDTDPSTAAAVPDYNDCAYVYTTIPVTASDTVAAHRHSPSRGGAFRPRKKLWVLMNVTAAGAYDFRVRVNVEVDV